MLRYRMNRIIKLLEQGKEDEVLRLVSENKYNKALQALHDIGTVNVVRNWGRDVFRVFLLDHYATYQLERHDVWMNRLIGFLFGVGASVVSAIITGLLPI